MYIDSHAHISMIIKERGLSINSVIEEMVNNNVNCVLDISGTEEEFEYTYSLKELFNNAGIKTVFAIGVHPHESAQFIDKDISWIRKNSDKIVAIGEVGLDYHYDFSPRNIQEKMFRKMIEISIETEKPLIIHARNAEDYIIEILNEYDLSKKNILFHCYTGTVETAKKIMGKGWFISFSGILTFKKNSGVSDVFLISDKEKIFFETDSPFLSPHPFRGQVNAPGKVKYVYEYASKILNNDLEAFSKKIKDNFDHFLTIS